MAKKKRVQLEERDGVVGKECTKCGEWKALENYAKQKTGLGKRISRCKLCRIEYDKNYYENHRDKLVERSRIHYERNRESYTAYARDWRRLNRDRYSVTQRSWKQGNADKVMILSNRRRARKSSLPNEFTEEKMSIALDFFCGCSMTGSKGVHWDHVIPLSSGHGGSTKQNMIPLRGDLNASKRDSNIFEWFVANRQRFELSQARFDKLIAWLASANALTTDEYRDFVYWCHANKREVDEIKRDQRHSIEIWREAAGKQFPLPAYTETYYANENDRKEVS